MSRAAAFAATEAIRGGEWDRDLLAVHRAVTDRLAVLDTNIRHEALRIFAESELIGDSASDRADGEQEGRA